MKHFHFCISMFVCMYVHQDNSTPMDSSLCSLIHQRIHHIWMYLTTNVIAVILTWQNALLTSSHAFAPIFIIMRNIFYFSSRERRVRRVAALFRTLGSRTGWSEMQEWLNPTRPTTAIFIQQDQIQCNYAAQINKPVHTWKGWSRM